MPRNLISKSRLVIRVASGDSNEIPRAILIAVVRLLCAAIAVAACFVDSLAQDYGTLGYTKRGNHWEGLRTVPISGGIQLLSARVVGQQRRVVPPRNAPYPWDATAFARFWLPEDQQITFTIQQIRPQSSPYVLDRVDHQWTAGRAN